MKANGSNIRQLTFGPYHNVHPNYLPDGRIVFSSSRMGTRDEYHGYPACGISVMNNDGSDFHVVGFNLGLDAEPVVATDGKILFTSNFDEYSLENFLLGKVRIPQESTFFRREALELTGGWRQEVSYAADTDFFLRMSFLTPVKRVEKIFARRIF